LQANLHLIILQIIEFFKKNKQILIGLIKENLGINYQVEFVLDSSVQEKHIMIYIGFSVSHFYVFGLHDIIRCCCLEFFLRDRWAYK
jgi:hypothetical protein